MDVHEPYVCANSLLLRLWVKLNLTGGHLAGNLAYVPGLG